MKNKRNSKQKVKKYSVIIIPDSRAKVWRWEITRKKVEGFFAVSISFLLVMTGSIWGFAHYRDAYVATEDIRLQNAQFEQERFELLTKLTNLEEVVERTERFATRLESTMGLNSEFVDKSIGPLLETDFSEPIIYKNLNNLTLGTNNSNLAFSDLDDVMADMESSIGSVEGRLQTVYEVQQDRLTYLASLPSIWPAKGWVTSGFGPRRRPIRGGTRFHKGIDVAAPSGTAIMSSGDGIITFSGYKRGLGRTIIVDHGYGVVSIYGHNSKNYVKEGDRVMRGEIIGSVGSTGLSTGSHLHYQIEVDGVPVDPMNYLKVHM